MALSSLSVNTHICVVSSALQARMMWAPVGYSVGDLRYICTLVVVSLIVSLQSLDVRRKCAHLSMECVLLFITQFECGHIVDCHHDSEEHTAHTSSNRTSHLHFHTFPVPILDPLSKRIGGLFWYTDQKLVLPLPVVLKHRAQQSHTPDGCAQRANEP